MRKEWWRIGVPLLLVAYIVFLNRGEPVRDIVTWAGLLVLLILVLNLVINPHLFGRRSRP